jgi:uncharacterized DUF497 family protein
LRIAFNPAKDAINQQQHGLSLGLAEDFAWSDGRFFAARTVRNETRMQMIVAHEGRVYSTIFTTRGDTFWIISLRPASRKERRLL